MDDFLREWGDAMGYTDEGEGKTGGMVKAETFRQWKERRAREAAADSGASLRECREMVEAQNDIQAYHLELAGLLMSGGRIPARVLDAMPVREMEYFRHHIAPRDSLTWYIPRAIRTGDGWGAK